jgi:hypothetical protein
VPSSHPGPARDTVLSARAFAIKFNDPTDG